MTSPPSDVVEEVQRSVASTHDYDRFSKIPVFPLAFATGRRIIKLPVEKESPFLGKIET